MALPETTISEIIDGVYNGEISLFELPSTLYAYTVKELNNSLMAAFGDIPKGNIKEIEKAINFRENIGRFSGAKTFQNVKDLTALVFDADGKKTPFAQFKQEALKINKKYNVHHLRTEQDSVFSQSQNARKWLKMEGEKEIFPVLEYVTVGDDRVDPAHAALDGLRLPVDHPKWNEITPQNRFNCRCILIQKEATRTATKQQIEDKTRLVEADFKKQRAAKSMSFDYNPGKVDFVFKEQGKGKHPYFRVPREFSDELKSNFGLSPVSMVIKAAPKAAVSIPKVALPKVETVKTTEFVPAKTKAEGKKALNTLFEKEGFNVGRTTFASDIEMSQVNAANKQIDKLFKEYRISSAYEKTTPINLAYRSSGSSYGVVTHAYKHSGQGFTKSANFGHKYTHRQGFGVINNSRIDILNNNIGTVTHEFAHLITDTGSVKYIKNVPKEIKEFWREVRFIRNDYWDELSSHRKKGLKELSKEIDSIHLGKYANSDLDEFMAEAFTNYKLHSEPSKYAIKVGKLIDKYFKK